MNTGVPQGINPSEYLNLTSRPMGPENLERAVMDQLGRVGGALKNEQAANSHLGVLSEMMSGAAPFGRLDLTTAGSAQFKVGKHVLDIPTANAIAHTVDLRGVKYAPLATAVYDGESYRMLSASDALKVQLTALRPAIKDQGIRTQMRAMKQTVSAWRKQSLMTVRFNAKASGGALPWALSHQVAFHGGPVALRGRELETSITEAIGGVTGKRRGHGTGAFRQRGGLGYQRSRQALVSHLALVMEGLTVDGVESVGVKAVRMTGHNPLGGKRVQEGQAGRVIFSRLPGHATGLHFPGGVSSEGAPYGQLPKSIHHMRERMFLPSHRLLALRDAAAQGLDTTGWSGDQISRLVAQRQYKLGMGTRRNVMPVLRNNWDTQARIKAGEHYALQGAVSRGTKTQGVMSTPMKIMGIGIRGNLTRREAEIAGKAMGFLFADSGALVASDYAAGVLNIHQETLTLRNLPGGKLTSGAGAMGGRALKLHPALQARLKGKGMQGIYHFDEALTQADLPAIGGQKAGYVGSALHGDGEVMMKKGRELTLRLGKRDRLVGFQLTPAGMRPLVHRTPRHMESGHPFLANGKRLGAMARVEGHGRADIITAMDFGGSFRGDATGAGGKLGEHGLGLDAFEQNLRASSELEYLRQEGGEDGLKRLSKNFPGLQVKTERIRHGKQLHVEHVLDYGKGDELDFDGLMAAIGKTRKQMGLSASGVRSGELGNLNNMFMGMMGPAGRKMLRESGIDSLEQLLETRSMFSEVANRAGQPVRGAVGTVRYTLRDLNMYSVQTAAMGGEDVKSMFRNLPAAMRRASSRRGINLSDAEVEQLSGAHSRYHKMATNAAMDVRSPDRSFIEAQLAIAEGRVPSAGSRSRHFNVTTWKDFQKNFTNVLSEYEKGGSLEQFRGSHLVEEVNGRLVPTSRSTIIDMGVEGRMPLERKPGVGQALNRRYISLPGGRSLGLQAGEPAFIAKGAGGLPGLGYDTLSTVRALHGQDAALATSESAAHVFQAAGRLQLSGQEKLFGKGHKAFGQRLKHSFSGTLVSNSDLAVGEVGISKSNLNRMLKKAGFRGKELRDKVKAIAKGSEDYYSTFKIEPMRGTQESVVAKVRLTSQERGRNKILSTAGELVSGRREAIEVNPQWLPSMFRDVDHDPGYLYNLAQGSKSQLKADYLAEQQVKAFQHRYMQSEYEATAHFAQMRMSQKIVQSSTKRSLTAAQYSSLMDEAMKLMSPGAQKRVTGGIFGKSLAATMAAGPELLTPVANLRWRRTRQMLENIASGSGLDDFTAKLGVTAGQRQIAGQAIQNVRGDTSAIKWMLRLSEESEYNVLKKGKILSLLMGGADAAASVDPKLMALSYADELLNPNNTKAYNKAVGSLASEIRNLAGASNAGWLGTFASTEGIDEIAASTRIAKMIASGEQIMQAAEESQMEWLQRMGSAAQRGQVRMPDGGALPMAARMLGRDPDFANRAMGGYVGPAGEAARTGAQGVPGTGSGIRDAAKRAAGEGVETAKALWGSKYGKPIMIGAAALMGLGVIQAMTGGGGAGAHGSGTMGGAPLPPPPMLAQNAMDRGEFITPKTSFAYMDRPAQVRTQRHFSVGTNGRSADFMSIADAEMGAMGQAPMHSGLMYDTTSPMMMRDQVDATIRQRMRSSF